MSTPSLFVSADRDALLARVRGLSPSATRQWGKMDVAQMMAHLNVALHAALGDTTYKRGLLGYLFGGLAKGGALGPKPFGKGLPTDKSYVIRDARDFAKERAEVVALVERAARGGPGAFTTNPHPFFGPLEPSEWDVLMWKHVDHHLRQFGA
jgi:hypothetical protein